MILCCGEALIDMIPVETAEGVAFRPLSGGAPFNTARAIARLGAPAGLFTGLSTDLFGKNIRERLESDGVDLSTCLSSDRPTMLAFIATRDGQARYNFYTDGTAGRMIMAEDLPDIAPEAALFGGISLAMEPCGTTYEVLFHRWAKSGTALMLDPNIRPGFIRHETAYRNRLNRMIEETTILKLSDEDLTWLEGPGSVTKRCEALLARGPAMVVVTEGSKGARLHTRTQEVYVAARKARTVDTIGAGDAFNAGLLTCLHEQNMLSAEAIRKASPPSLQSAMDLAIAAAAVTVSRAGANPPLRSELG